MVCAAKKKWSPCSNDVAKRWHDVTLGVILKNRNVASHATVYVAQLVQLKEISWNRKVELKLLFKMSSAATLSKYVENKRQTDTKSPQTLCILKTDFCQ